MAETEVQTRRRRRIAALSDRYSAPSAPDNERPAQQEKKEASKNALHNERAMPAQTRRSQRNAALPRRYSAPSTPVNERLARQERKEASKNKRHEETAIPAAEAPTRRSQRNAARSGRYSAPSAPLNERLAQQEKKEAYKNERHKEAVYSPSQQLEDGTEREQASTSTKAFREEVPSESRYPRRQRKEVSYVETPEGNSQEEYLFCDDCGMDHPGDCPEHGPLVHIKDTVVEFGDPLRANKTLPEGLSIRRSTIKGAQLGVFTLKPLPKRVCFGPFEGVVVDIDGRNGYTWQVRKDGKVSLLDGRPLDKSNWMRYVNCAATPKEQNLLAYRHHGDIYYRTSKAVRAGEELFLWYGTEFARELGVMCKPQDSGSPLKGNVSSRTTSASHRDSESCPVN